MTRDTPPPPSHEDKPVADDSAARVGERLTGVHDPKDPDGLITLDDIAGPGAGGIGATGVGTDSGADDAAGNGEAVSDERADGPSNPGEGGEHRFDDVAPEPQTSTEESTRTDGETGPETGTGETAPDPATGTADGAVEPPD